MAALRLCSSLRMCPRRLPLALMGAGFLVAAGARAEEPEPRPEPKLSPIAILHAIDEGFVQVYEKVAPGVVIIDVTKKREEPEGDEPETFEPFPDAGSGKMPHPDSSRPWRLPQQPSRSRSLRFRFARPKATSSPTTMWWPTPRS